MMMSRRAPQRRVHRQQVLPFARPRQARSRSKGGAARRRGRKPSPERVGFVAHVPRPHHDARHPVHVTMKRVAAAPSFRVERVFVAVIRQIRLAVARGVRVLQFAVQADHLHLIVEASESGRLARDMQLLFSRIAFEVNRVALRSGKLFRDRHHRHELVTPTEVRRTLVYVLFNSRKHRLGGSLAAEPATVTRLRASLDPYGSVVWFDDWAPLARPPPELVAAERVRAGPSPLARPRTWLAAAGWMRARGGRIRFDELPSPAARVGRACAR
jgi:REP element-mobilizing transposase RayT